MRNELHDRLESMVFDVDHVFQANQQQAQGSPVNMETEEL